jgi:prephenate dehydrogenase
MNQKLTVGFLGLGLIGGSIARAMKNKLENVRIIAYDINRETLEAALDEGVADEILISPDQRFRVCDYLFLCAPVGENEELFKAAAACLGEEAILTDVGSVKAGIHSLARAAGLEKRFIGGHPMTGSERFGYRNTKAGLLENAYYILTPGEGVPADKVMAYQHIVSHIGGIPLILTPEEHDFVTAAVSHLPHVIASSLVNLVGEWQNAEDKELMKTIAAGGFKDITRIASSDPLMWQQICLGNRENIVTLLDAYMEKLRTFRTSLTSIDKDALMDRFQTARIYREELPEASAGPLKVSYTIKVDIPDEPGTLAAIATILALHNISIKNIGITHNREWEEGVLRIEFYRKEDLTQGSSILRTKGYAVHDKSDPNT